VPDDAAAARVLRVRRARNDKNRRGEWAQPKTVTTAEGANT